MESLEQQFSEDLSLTKSSNSMDTMIIQNVGLLDERDKQLYTYGKKENCMDVIFPSFLRSYQTLSSEQRAQLYVNLISIMNHGAPNLTALVGELVGARLISRGGGLTNLVKEGRLIQSLLTPLLRKKHEIPKSGLIYQVSQAAGKVKGKMTRSLAAKAALTIRCDAFGDCRNNTVGLKNRAKLEAWFKIILEAKPKIKVAKVETYDTDTDSLLVQTPTKSESEAMEE